MCLMALAWQQRQRFPLVLAANRDEYTDRPAAPMAWWQPAEGGPALLSGRDLRGGGTWLGLTRSGKLGLLTNVRTPAVTDPQAPTRGRIVIDWLTSDQPAEMFFGRLRGAAHAPFNLLAADLRENDWRWTSNIAEAPRPLQPGLTGLSNAALDTPWPKVQRLKQGLAEEIERVDSRTALIEALLLRLTDEVRASDADLPATGVPMEVERMLSSIFVRSPDGRYRTRCSTVLVVERTAAGCLTEVVELNHDDGTRACHTLPDWPPRQR
ncbi:NRDE family protein [Ideonella sp.]|uniref:NRDE family protein n=1 Tax=Ideonella sp. TaxID=1929293 RepID=UPI003BB69524